MSDQTFKNLDPNALNVKKEGWSAEDRARELLDIFNQSSRSLRAWKYEEFVKIMFPISGTHDFVEGFLIASLFMGEVISGGKVRECIMLRDGNTKTIDPLMMQRFLTWVEQQKETAYNADETANSNREEGKGDCYL